MVGLRAAAVQDVGSRTRDHTCALHWKCRVPTPGPPGSPCHKVFKLDSVSLPNLFFNKIVLVILGVLSFHTNFKVCLFKTRLPCSFLLKSKPSGIVTGRSGSEVSVGELPPP